MATFDESLNRQSLAELTTALSYRDVERFDDVLRKLQGNILKGHGRNYANHVLVHFGSGSESKVADWLIDFANRRITWTNRQFQQSKKFRESNEQVKSKDSSNEAKESGEPFVAFLMSAWGYKYLQVDTSGFDGCFKRGMQRSADALNDKPGDWEPNYTHQIHAMFILADDDSQRLDVDTNDLLRTLEGLGVDETFVERGLWKWGDNLKDEDRIEHFGFGDGGSNPVFFEGELDRIRSKIGTKNWNPGAPTSLVIVRDPASGGDEQAFGSYVVFRKLKQDVKGFIEERSKLATDIGVDPTLAGAFIMGRFEDGMPLALGDSPNSQRGARPPLNDFNYNDIDPQGIKCPVYSHIRKANPRGTSTDIDEATKQVESPDTERSHRIVRRGIPYGRDTDKDVGLLFICYQANIEKQFKFIQSQWANNIYFPTVGSGIDPLIGQVATPNKLTDQLWPTAYGSPGVRRRGFPSIVNMRGGEYFFAPSLSFFENLKKRS